MLNLFPILDDISATCSMLPCEFSNNNIMAAHMHCGQGMIPSVPEDIGLIISSVCICTSHGIPSLSIITEYC